MKNKFGYSLVELVIFIAIVAIVASSLLVTSSAILRKIPNVHQQNVASQAAINCAEWFLGQRYLNGYSSISCPSTTVPSYCTVPSGYTITTDIACTTIGTDSNYKTITIIVGGLEQANLKLLIADY